MLITPLSCTPGLQVVHAGPTPYPWSPRRRGIIQ